MSHAAWPHGADVAIPYSAESTARTVARALGQEVGAIDDDRSETTIERDGPTVRLHVDATDLVALRAATNTWLGLLRVAEETVSVGADAPA